MRSILLLRCSGAGAAGHVRTLALKPTPCSAVPQQSPKAILQTRGTSRYESTFKEDSTQRVYRAPLVMATVHHGSILE